MKLKRIVSLFLILAMLALPMTALSAFAAEDEGAETNITLGASALKGAQESKVYFGTYKQSKNSSGYNADPIKWRVLSNADGKLFLLADQNLDVFRYNTVYTSVTWETSTMRSWLNGYGSSSNAQGIDYSNDSFIGDAFSQKELSAILQTALENADNPTYGTEGGNDTTDKIFLLSIDEVLNTAYGFTNNTSSSNTRVSTNTAYVAGGGKIGSYMNSVGSADWWWLRSPGYYTYYAAYVNHFGYVTVSGYDVNHSDTAVRPAINLDVSSILFTTAVGNNEYRLTMLDASRSGFSAKYLTSGVVSYSGAFVGENEYISVIIKDADGNAKYYERLQNVTSESGNITVDFSDKLTSTDTLYVFNEQYNGERMTGFASALAETEVVEEPKTEGYCGKNVKWAFDGETGALTISGKGAMKQYSRETMPWYELADKITKVVIGEGVTSIGKNAFNNEKAGFAFTEISLPSTLTSIGNYAFYGCKSLDKVTIPASVNSIGKYAFRKSGVVDLTFEGANGWSVGSEGKFSFANKTAALNALVYRHYDKVWTATDEGDTTVNIIAVDRCGKNLNWMLSDDGVLTISGNGAMYEFGAKSAPWASYKAQIKSVVIGEGVTSIGNCAFYECANITSVSLPSTLTGIGNYAFYGCKALTEITVLASVASIGAYAFRKCTSLATATFENADGWSYGDASAAISAEALKANYKNAWTRA